MPWWTWFLVGIAVLALVYAAFVVVLVLAGRRGEAQGRRTAAARARRSQFHPRLSGGPCGPHPPLPTASAVVWALQEPLDRRLIGCDYSDVAVLGKAVTNGRAWWPAGFAMHLANGALFGLAYHEARRRWPARPHTLGVGLALGEHAALFPLCYFVDRFHPQRGATGVPALLKNRKAFVQATWRHAVFGLVLGRLA